MNGACLYVHVKAKDTTYGYRFKIIVINSDYYDIMCAGVSVCLCTVCSLLEAG